jgi:hypothetical protein
MASKQRVPMQVAPEFEAKIKEIQEKIMLKQGRNISLRDITEKIGKSPDFDNLEKSILNIANIDLKINFDRRKKI